MSFSGVYDLRSWETDQFIADHPDFLAVYAAGNIGGLGMATTSTHASAKNVLTVGSAFTHFDGMNYMQDFSGVGLTFQGEIVVFKIGTANFGPLWLDVDPIEETLYVGYNLVV